MASKILIPFSTVPMTPPKIFFNKAYSIITDLIWGKKKHRIKRKVLHLPKLEGGFNLPDLELYDLASQAFYLRHIVKSTIEERWIQVKNAQVYPQNLLLYIFSNYKNSSVNFVVRTLATTWSKIKGILSELISVPKIISL